MSCMRVEFPIQEDAGNSTHRPHSFCKGWRIYRLYDVADRVMELLAGCSPKDFSPCENRQCTKGSLERLQHRIREKLEKS